MREFRLFPDARQRVEQADPVEPTSGLLPRLADKPGGVLLVQAKAGRADDTVPFQRGPWAAVLDGVAAKRGAVSADTVLRDGAAELTPEHVSQLAHTVQQAKPALIIAFGAPAHEALLGDRPNVYTVRRCFAFLSDGTPVVCLPSVLGLVGQNRILRGWVSKDLGWAITTDFGTRAAPCDLVGRSVETVEDAWVAVRDMAARGGCSLDTETFGRMYTAEFKITQLALAHHECGYAYHWGPDALDPAGPLAEPLRWLLQHVPIDGHNLKYDVLALWCHLGMRMSKPRWCTRLAAKIAQADTSARLDDQSYRVGWGGHKVEAARAVDVAANIVKRLRTATAKDVPTATRREKYENAKGQVRNRTVVVSSRPPARDERIERVHAEWCKLRSVDKVQTSWSALTGVPAPTADWLTAVLGDGDAKEYAYGLIPQDIAERYVCRDTMATAWLVPLVDGQLTPGQRHTWDSFMSGVTGALAQLQYNGLPVSVDRLEQLASVLDQKERDARQALARFAPADLNWGSTDQLRDLLYKPVEEGGLGMPVLRTAKKSGKPSTARLALDELYRRTKHPAIPPLLELREAMKLQSNYARGMTPFVQDGRIHCNLTPMGAETGRCSCNNPNLQTIPSRSGLSKLVKSCYVAPPGYKLVQFDYSTLELRVMAFLSGEQSMIDSFLAGRDLHRDTARMISEVVWGSDFDTCGLGYSFYDLIAPHDGDAAVLYADRDGQVSVGEHGWTQAHEQARQTAMYGRPLAPGEREDPDKAVPAWAALAKEQSKRRKIAKIVNFACAYGQGPKSMADAWGISEQEARDAQSAIMGKRRKLSAWFERQKRQCAATGYIDTWWDGQPSTRRYIVDIGSPADSAVGHAERAAGNTPVQGTGSHFCMSSLVAIDEWIRTDGVDAQLILSVHDSVLLLVAEPDLPELLYQVPRIMTQWASMGCPITVDAEVGDDWGHMAAAA